jgi:thiol-disulfide isomerase/thioredoxin
MKKIFILAMAAAAMVSCGSDYTITGSSESFTDGKWAFLGVPQGRQLVKSDSVQIVNNTFTLKGDVETPYAAYIAIGEVDARPEMYIEVIVENGPIQIKKLKAQDRSFSAVGTPLNDKFVAFNDKMETAQTKEEVEDIIKTTINENIDNALGLKIFKDFYYYLAPQEIIDIVSAMPEATQTEESVTKMKQSAEQALKVLPGNPYIDVADKDADGKEITLKSVVENKKNKYILLDFWASWCGPCMGDMPHLKAAYEKYHKKGFEIFAISLDSYRDEWLQTIKNHDLKWIHVSSLKQWDSAARAAYAVSSIPANFLIDCSTGEIIASQLRDGALEEKLAELLK